MTEMTIERARPADLDDLVRMGRAMRDESVAGFPDIDPDAVAAHLRVATANPDRVFFAIARSGGQPAGFVSGVIGPYAFSPALHAACDLLFVLPAFRGRFTGVRLLRALCDWAAGQGARAVELGLSTGIDPDRTGKLVEKIGFAPLGRTFRKELEICARRQHSR